MPAQTRASCFSFLEIISFTLKSEQLQNKKKKHQRLITSFKRCADELVSAV